MTSTTKRLIVKSIVVPFDEQNNLKHRKFLCLSVSLRMNVLPSLCHTCARSLLYFVLFTVTWHCMTNLFLVSPHFLMSPFFLLHNLKQLHMSMPSTWQDKWRQKVDVVTACAHHLQVEVEKEELEFSIGNYLVKETTGVQNLVPHKPAAWQSTLFYLWTSVSLL